MRLALLLSVFAVVFAGAIGVGLVVRHDSGAVAAFEGPGPGAYRGSEPPPGLRAPQFSLRSYRGRIVRMGDLRGRVVLVTFLDTACTETCPIIASQISASLRLLPPGIRREVVALAISVEPRTDTAEHVHAFLAKRRALGLDFLIGTPRELRPVWRAFAILPAYDTGDADVHSADVRVFDRTGIWVSTLHAGVDLTPANLAHDIRRALAD